MAEKESPETKLREFISLLQKIVECPICLDTIKVPFKTCSTGHGACKSCCNKLKECPLCKGSFTAENPVCLKSILEALPQSCSNREVGCEENVEQGSDHEKFCGYRPIACPHRKCEVKLPLIEIVGHYEEYHPYSVICETPRKTTPLVWSKFNLKKTREDHLLVLVFKNIFWLSYSNNVEQKRLIFSFRATPIGKLESDYFAKVKFEKGDFAYTSTIKASVLHYPDIEDDKENEDDGKDDDSEEEKYVMEIPQSALDKFTNTKRELEYTVFFFEEAK